MIQTVNGLGKPSPTLTVDSINMIEKGEYAADFLYFASLCCIKLSVLALVRLITPSRLSQFLIWAFEAVVVAWTVSAIFAHAFECSLPNTWDYMNNSCFDRLSFWNYFEVLNLLTDTGIVILACLIVFPVQTSIRKKLAIIGVFAIRLVPVGAEITKLVFWNRLHGSPDPLFDLWPTIICTQAIQCSSVIAACALYLRPFLEMLQSGFLNLDDMRRNGTMTPFTMTSQGQMAHLSINDSDNPQHRQRGRPVQLAFKRNVSSRGDGIFRGKGNTSPGSG
ncbi:hypothetical protein MMC10_005718 [Thelotrema lepadinum]|nr:hypothetical protein [Thelotrema lepadinum]